MRAVRCTATRSSTCRCSARPTSSTWAVTGAGMAALGDGGLAFRDVQAAYTGHIFASPMSGVRVMKEFGLTGLPIQRIENASATGSAAFREACMAVAAGYYD